MADWRCAWTSTSFSSWASAARPIHLGACLEGSWGEESVFVRDNDAALAWLREHVVPGDVVLFKASRAARSKRWPKRCWPTRRRRRR